MADPTLKQVQQIVKGMGSTGILRYLLTPALTGVPAVGAVVTCGAGAWAGYTALIAALAITVDHWICAFDLDTAGAVQIFEVQVSDATPTVLTEFRIDPTAVTVNLGRIPVGPYPIYRPANALTQARSGGAAAKVLGVSTLYTTGL